MDEEKVSFYQIAKELAEEEKVDCIIQVNKKSVVSLLIVDGKIMDKNKFDDYRKKRQEYLEKLLTKPKLLEQFKQESGEFAIPISQKEHIKFLLREYASPIPKKMRKYKIQDINSEDFNKVIKRLEDFIGAHVAEVNKESELTSIYVTAECKSRNAFSEVMAGILKMANDDLRGIKYKPVREDSKKPKLDNTADVHETIRIGNDSDAAYLMYYYYYMMREQSRKWNKLLDVISELRTEEIIDVFDREIESGEDSEKDYKFRDISEVVFQAGDRLYEDAFGESLERQDENTEKMKDTERIMTLIKNGLAKKQ